MVDYYGFLLSELDGNRLPKVPRKPEPSELEKSLDGIDSRELRGFRYSLIRRKRIPFNS